MVVIKVTSPTSQLILRPLCRFTYVRTHSPTLPLLHLRHNSFSNPFVASPTLQLIVQPFFRFSHVTWRGVHVKTGCLFHGAITRCIVDCVMLLNFPDLMLLAVARLLTE